jgi:hypothetical protein
VPRHRPRHDAQHRELPDPGALIDVDRQTEGAADPPDHQRRQPPVLGRLPRAAQLCCSAARIALACAIRLGRSVRIVSARGTMAPMSGRGTVFSFVVFHRCLSSGVGRQGALTTSR